MLEWVSLALWPSPSPSPSPSGSTVGATGVTASAGGGSGGSCSAIRSTHSANRSVWPKPNGAMLAVSSTSVDAREPDFQLFCMYRWARLLMSSKHFPQKRSWRRTPVRNFLWDAVPTVAMDMNTAPCQSRFAAIRSPSAVSPSSERSCFMSNPAFVQSRLTRSSSTAVIAAWEAMPRLIHASYSAPGETLACIISWARMTRLMSESSTGAVRVRRTMLVLGSPRFAAHASTSQRPSSVSSRLRISGSGKCVFSFIGQSTESTARASMMDSALLPNTI